MIPRAWTLPGPARWLDGVIADISAGRCVVCRIPRTWTQSHLHVAAQEARPHDYFELVDARDASLEDAVLALAPDSRSVGEALARLGAQEITLWIRTSAELTAGELETLAEAHRHAADVPRALIVEHTGPLKATEPPRAPTLAVHHLYAALSTLDTQVLLLSSHVELTATDRAQIAEIAGFDLDLALELAAGEADAMQNICVQRAQRLFLEQLELPSDDQAPKREPRRLDLPWLSGAFDMFESRPRKHAGLLNVDQFQRLVWRGQIQVLLPAIDEARLELWEILRRSGIHPSSDEAVEIAHVKYLLRKRPERHLARFRPAADELHRARNDLSHLRPLSRARRRRLWTELQKVGLPGHQAM
jgi:hypothetical protein